MIEDFIEKNKEQIYEKYCEIYPEIIHSDFMLEDVDDIDDFIETYMGEEI